MRVAARGVTRVTATLMARPIRSRGNADLPRRVLRSTLLRANPPKDGDAEPRGYSGPPPRLPGRQRSTWVDVGGPHLLFPSMEASRELHAGAGPSVGMSRLRRRRGVELRAPNRS